jgi:CO dehydrogenase/acetyl-CoA synthase alpha subunit
MASRLFVRPGGFREARRSHIDMAVDVSNRYFGKLPDDWQLWVRSDSELPARYKFKLLKLLKEKYGWMVDERKILKAKHRDGRLLSMEEFSSEYGMEQGTYLTNIFKLLPKSAREAGEKKGEGVV